MQITFRLAEKYWGEGLATEIAIAIRDYAFSKLGLSEIIGIVDPQNAPSIHILEKIGMKFDRTVIYGGLSLQIYKLTGKIK